jgi:hypothetical protein
MGDASTCLYRRSFTPRSYELPPTVIIRSSALRTRSLTPPLSHSHAYVHILSSQRTHNHTQSLSSIPPVRPPARPYDASEEDDSYDPLLPKPREPGTYSALYVGNLLWWTTDMQLEVSVSPTPRAVSHSVSCWCRTVFVAYPVPAQSSIASLFFENGGKRKPCAVL